jgi:hypothetical protein
MQGINDKLSSSDKLNGEATFVFPYELTFNWDKNMLFITI